MYRISHPTKILKGSITLSSSKSESNRALIIQALCKDKFEIKNLSTSEDTIILQKILNANNVSAIDEITFDVGAAGTTMRFLTAFFATKPGTYILTGSQRMKKRPIGILVEALRQLGADIEYLEKEGFPPLQINGKHLNGGEVEIDGNISSQFISALLLISPEFKNGLVIKFKGEVTSRPYIDMTLKMMQEFRVYGIWQDGIISVSQQNYYKKSDLDYFYKVEADWSSASYWYSMATLAKETDLIIKGLKKPSLQGDAMVADMFTFFGIKSEFIEEGIRLTKTSLKEEHFGFDFSDCPDLVQTIAVVISALGISGFFNGLLTLKIKETDRISALQNELMKLGVKVEIENDNCMKLTPPEMLNHPKIINTYDDHRMAMAFAALAMVFDSIVIEEPDVVKKSYRNFWLDLKHLGFQIEEVSEE